MSKEPLVSVVIPTYNRSEALQKALEALDAQDQEGRPFEVIVVDDGSTDGTAAYLAKAEFSYPLRSIRQENKGPAAARNRGLELAEGETVLFLNDDCLAAPNLLAEHLRYRREFGEIAVLGHIEWSPEIVLAQEVETLVKTFYFPFQQITDPEDVPFVFFITGNLSVPLAKVREAGGFDEDFREAAFEDIDLGYRLEKLRVRVRYNRSALAYHYHHLDFDDLCDRHQKVGYWLQAFLAKHPEAEIYYQGMLNLYRGDFPVKEVPYLHLILSYMGYRGLKAGWAKFRGSRQAPNPA